MTATGELKGLILNIKTPEGKETILVKDYKIDYCFNYYKLTYINVFGQKHVKNLRMGTR